MEILMQKENELAFAKFNQIPFLKSIFINNPLVESFIDPKYALNLLVQIALHKRFTPGVGVGITKGEKTAQEASNLLQMAILHGLVKYNGEEIIVKYQPTPEEQAQLDTFMFPLPLVEEPLKVKSNKECGFHSRRETCLLKVKHDEDICLDFLNLQNKIQYSINPVIAETVKNVWPNMVKQSTKEKQKAFDKYNKYAKIVLSYIQSFTSFYLVNKYDHRGRVYSTGYYINPQGNDWNRACIELYHKEKING